MKYKIISPTGEITIKEFVNPNQLTAYLANLNDPIYRDLHEQLNFPMEEIK